MRYRLKSDFLSKSLVLEEDLNDQFNRDLEIFWKRFWLVHTPLHSRDVATNLDMKAQSSWSVISIQWDSQVLSLSCQEQARRGPAMANRFETDTTFLWGIRLGQALPLHNAMTFDSWCPFPRPFRIGELQSNVQSEPKLDRRSLVSQGYSRRSRRHEWTAHLCLCDSCPSATRSDSVFQKARLFESDGAWKCLRLLWNYTDRLSFYSARLFTVNV
jgi:hypothetical protein